MDSIVRISRTELRSGRLFGMFSSGVKAVILEKDDRVLKLWQALLGSGDETGNGDREILPWEGSLSDMARNHRSRQGVGSHYGDVFFYRNNEIAYTARKLILFEGSGENKLRTAPEYFLNGNRRFRMPERIRRLVWELGTEVFQSALPTSAELPAYCMTVERLKYEDSYSDVEKIMVLLNNSSATGKWVKFGRTMESNKKTAEGPFGRRYVSDLFALLCQIPGLRSFVRRSNEIFRSSRGTASLGDNAKVIGEAHTDGKLVSCLSSLRASIKTEIFDGENWVELPLTRDSFAILPGRGLARFHNVKPTLHRILHVAGAKGSAGKNRTLILGLRPDERGCREESIG